MTKIISGNHQRRRSYFTRLKSTLCLIVFFSVMAAATYVRCPVNPWPCLNVTDAETKELVTEPSNPGRTVRFGCCDHGENHSYAISNRPHDFFPYPSFSTCQKNGIWESVRPICIDKLTLTDPDAWIKLKVHCQPCSDRECLDGAANWETIGGHPLGSREIKGDVKSLPTFFKCDFGRSVHLSAMTFRKNRKADVFFNSFQLVSPQLIEKGTFGVTLMVDPRDVIHDRSSEASSLHEKYCDNIKKHVPGWADDTVSVLCHLRAYTREVLVNTTVGENFNSEFIFYAFPRVIGCENNHPKQPVKQQNPTTASTQVFVSTPQPVPIDYGTTSGIPWWGILLLLLPIASSLVVGSVRCFATMRRRKTAIAKGPGYMEVGDWSPGATQSPTTMIIPES